MTGPTTPKSRATPLDRPHAPTTHPATDSPSDPGNRAARRAASAIHTPPAHTPIRTAIRALSAARLSTDHLDASGNHSAQDAPTTHATPARTPPAAHLSTDHPDGLASRPGSERPAVRLATVTGFDPDLAHLDPTPTDPTDADDHPGDSTYGELVRASGWGRRTARPTSLHPGTSGTEGRLAQAGSGRASVAQLQQALDAAGAERELPTHPAVRELLAGTGLRSGSAYSVRGSAALVMALMAGPSADGAWCGVVGVPSFGAEAARGLGVDLERLVLVPDPGREWLSVVAALVDALTVVVVRPPGEVTPGEASRLAARLRTRGAMLIAYGSWPGSEARFEIESSTWTGLGDGEGLLTARRATVTVTGRRAAVNARKHHLWLPAPDGEIRSTTPTGHPETVNWTTEPPQTPPPDWSEIGAVG